MEPLKRKHTPLKNHKTHQAAPQDIHMGAAANKLFLESKKFASHLYEEGLDKVETTEDKFKAYSDEFSKKVQANPLTSILIAGGIGFLLSSMFKK